MQRVVANFLLGLNRMGVKYTFNRIAYGRKSTEKIICFGLGKTGLQFINKRSPLIAAIGFPIPQELPELNEYDLRKFLQHSEWVLNLSKLSGVYPSDVFATWAAGINTEEWIPSSFIGSKSVDVLIYNKLYRNSEEERQLLSSIKVFLNRNGFTFKEIEYGKYWPDTYKLYLSTCKVMIFLSAHESQGFAYLEALSAGVPVFAWNQGFWLDPKRIELGLPAIKASSIPFFDERCGGDFGSAFEFEQKFPAFFDQASRGRYQPRDYVLEHLTIEKSTRRLLDIYHSI